MAVARRSFFPSPKGGADKIIAICCWSSAVTDSILFEHELNWKQFQRGVDRNCSAFSTMETSPSPNQLEQRNQQPSLSDMVRRAIQLLQYNTGGYFLVVDAGLMRKAAQETTEKGPSAKQLNWTARSVSHEAMGAKIDDHSMR